MKVEGRTFCARQVSIPFVQMEGELMKLFNQTREAGGLATLTFSVKGGKTRAKLQLGGHSEH